MFNLDRVISANSPTNQNRTSQTLPQHSKDSCSTYLQNMAKSDEIWGAGCCRCHFEAQSRLVLKQASRSPNDTDSEQTRNLYFCWPHNRRHRWHRFSTATENVGGFFSRHLWTVSDFFLFFHQPTPPRTSSPLLPTVRLACSPCLTCLLFVFFFFFSFFFLFIFCLFPFRERCASHRATPRGSFCRLQFGTRPFVYIYTFSTN